MNKIYHEIENFSTCTTIENSQISEDLKKEIIFCLENKKFLPSYIEDIDDTPIQNPSFEINFTQRDINISKENNLYSMLAYCNKYNHSPYFKKGNKFETQNVYPPKTIRYERIANNSGFIISLSHEISHCIDYKYLKRYNKNLEELGAWYGACKICKDILDQGFNVLEGFGSLDKLADYMDLYMIWQTRKKTTHFVNRERLLEILGPNTFK